jgi:hypothetical protein
MTVRSVASRPFAPRLFEPRPFRAAPWAEGAHAQTLMTRALRSADGPPLERERMATPDVDFLDLD